MRPLIPLTAALALAFPSAALADGPSLEQALLAADREWAGHACEGRVDVRYGDLPGHGAATGLESYWNGTAWVWVRARCEITVRPDLETHRRCRVIVHEVGHLARGDGSHDEGHGAMSADGGFEGAEGCRTVEPSKRTRLKDAIRDALPGSYGPWAVVCTPNARVMRCRAESELAKHTRRFSAGIDGSYRRVK